MQSSKFFLFTIFTALVSLTSCQRSDDPTFAQKIELSTDSVSLPSESITLGNTVQITTYHKLAANCELFHGFSEVEVGEEKQITAYYLKTDSVCGATSVSQAFINFTPKRSGTFRLKFWKENNQWVEKTLEVLPSPAP
ncbi:hypothetical protein ACX3PU_06015 [Chryseobacterium sp. A301]